MDWLKLLLESLNNFSPYPGADGNFGEPIPLSGGNASVDSSYLDLLASLSHPSSNAPPIAPALRSTTPNPSPTSPFAPINYGGKEMPSQPESPNTLQSIAGQLNSSVDSMLSAGHQRDLYGGTAAKNNADYLNSAVTNMQNNAAPPPINFNVGGAVDAVADPVSKALGWMRNGRDQGGYLGALFSQDFSNPGAEPKINNVAQDNPLLGAFAPNIAQQLGHQNIAPPSVPVTDNTGTRGMPTPLPDNSTPAPNFGGNSGGGVLQDALTKWGFNNPSTPVAPPVSPMQDIYDLYKQLLSNVSGTAPQVQSEKDLKALAQQQIDAQFDPQIALLESQMQERQDRYDDNKREVLALWNSLAGEYGGAGLDSSAAYGDAQAEQAGNSADIEALIREGYNQSSDYMGDQFGKLGIGDVSSYIDPLLSSDQDYNISKINNGGSAFDQYLASNSAASGNYMSGMADSAKMHGAETVEDLLSELNTYMDAANIQMGGLQNQKLSGVNAMVAQMLMDQQKAQADYQQQMFNNLLNAGQFRVSMQNLENSMQPKPVENKQKTYNSGVLGAMQQFAGSPNSAKLSDLFKQLTTNQEFVENRFPTPSGDITKMTPGRLAQAALQLAQDNQLSPEDTQALWNAVYAYYGQLGK